MARYKHIDTSARFLPVDLAAQLLPGIFEFHQLGNARLVRPRIHLHPSHEERPSVWFLRTCRAALDRTLRVPVYIGACVSLLVATPAASAQQSTRPVNEPSRGGRAISAKTATGFSDLPIVDTAPQVLPPGLRMVTPGALAERVPNTSRGEYETTAAYRARVSATAPTRLIAVALELANVNSGGRPLTNGSDPCTPTVRYDADEGAFLINLVPAELAVTRYEDDKEHADGLAILCRASGTDLVAGRDVLGQPHLVQRRFVDKIVVGVVGLDADDIQHTWAVEVAPAVAQALRPRLRVALLVRPQPGPRGAVVERSTIHAPADPRFARITAEGETLERSVVVWAAPAILVAYDARTGAVLSRHPLAPPPERDIARHAASSLADQPYFQFQVERAAELVSGTLKPRYPEQLQSRVADATVDVQFVVEKSGLVNESTWKLLSSPDPALNDAAWEAVRAARFTPAEIDGHKVRQLVHLTLTFKPDP